MAELSYRRHRSAPVVIQHAVWLYLRFTLSYRDVEDLLAERGLDISYETIRSWVLKFGPVIARRLRRRRPRSIAFMLARPDSPRGNAICRMVDASEVAFVAAFLASEKAWAVSGELVAAGGGAGRSVYY